MGLKNVARSTVADANTTRPVGFFRDLFAEMYGLCASKAPKHKFRFKSRLFSPDATTIRLCLSLFPWASFRKTRGGIKMHVPLDHDGHIPAFVAITGARTHESRIARTLEPPRGSIVVFDKGYVDHNWFQALGARNISFVTRLKRNIVCTLLERRFVNRRSGVTSDHVIEVATRGKPLRLRRTGYRDPESGRRYEFLTNQFRLRAQTIADICELFFKEIKQSLRIRSFVGNSENAVMIQIFTALTVYLLLAYQKFLSRFGISVQQLCQLIQINLPGVASLEDLLRSQRRKIENSFNLSLLSLAP